ncbi:DUF3800 domain-containing protein [Micromonospora sp. Llam7]|uniref:DUF3800 domain-containing protein n=1 Tax=Micromonospora tarapacensis TaxID=2835305 RepID=UPI001C833A9E|nr:DUF3800 domain-containing protein [Micromonospora tarapacensis]
MSRQRREKCRAGSRGGRHSGVVFDEAPTVYADESSNSGENLLDPYQPVFAVAAVRLSAVDAQAMVQSVLDAVPPRQGEPKYGSLAKSWQGQAALMSVLPTLGEDVASAFVAHKRFMIISKMIDCLVVELAWADGYDMYADGSAVGLANLMHLAGPVLGDESAYESMLATFVNAIRPNQPTVLDDLFDAVEAYRRTTRDGLDTHVGLLLAARWHAQDLVNLIDARKIRDVLDPAVPCLIELCRHVGAAIGEFHLVHDSSKTINRHLPLLLSLDQVPAVTPGLPAQALPVVDITFADSSTTPQLIIADWVAGAVRQVGQARATGTDEDSFVAQLVPLAERWTIGGVWPNKDLITMPRRI